MADRDFQGNDAKFQALMAHSPDIISIRDRHGVYLDINPAGAEAIGKPVSEIVGRHASEVLPPDVLEQVLADDARLLTDRVPMTSETGSVEHQVFQTKKFPFFGEDGAPIGVMGISRDITAERHQQRELVEQRRLSETLLAHVPAGIAFLDRDLIFRRVNRAYCEMWQMAPDQFIGRQVYDVFPRITRSGHFDKVLATHEPLEVKNVAYPQRQDGAVRETVWDITFVPVLEGDELIGIQVFTVEVSPRVEAERLKDERLRRLQEVDRLKDDFVSATSHELRTPLTSIMGFAEFLQDEVEGPLTEGQRAFLCAIQGSVLRLQRVVDDLLDFARIESGTVELQRADVDLVELLRRELVTVEPQARDKDLTLLADLGDSPVVANVDPQRLGQVVLNLLANAVKFSAPGGKVALRLIPEVQGPRIEVVDTGPGIPPESIPRLFERFYQVDPSLTRQHGGAGLGLAIARALVEAHEGLIGVESELGRGSTFWVSLPASAAP